VVGALFAVVGVVQAALPPKNASFEFADHATAGKNWHVDFTVDEDSRRKLESLIVYSEQCDATVVARHVPISDGAGEGGGNWAVNATFTASKTIVGAMRMIRPGCDTGVLSFPNANTGDGTAVHVHGGKYADFADATLKQRRQARRLQAQVLKFWRGVTPAGAKRRGFHVNRAFPPDPSGLVFHVYNVHNEKDHRIFDARRPESLVFSRPTQGKPVLLGPMFRVPPGKRPGFAGPIPIYHSHPSHSGKIVSLMTHVWIVKPNRKIAWANCLPVKQLEAYNPGFTWAPKPGVPPLEHFLPC